MSQHHETVRNFSTALKFNHQTSEQLENIPLSWSGNFYIQQHLAVRALVGFWHRARETFFIQALQYCESHKRFRILCLPVSCMADPWNCNVHSLTHWLPYWHDQGPWFNIKISSYQHRKSHCGDKTILRPSYLHNGISYTSKMSSLYWIGAQDPDST